MAARFYCCDTFGISERLFFVLAGRVRDGVIRGGMNVRIPLADGSYIGIEIASVEIIHAPAPMLGLVVKCENQDQLDFYRSLSVSDLDLNVD